MRGAAGDAAIDAAKAAGEGGGDDDAGTAAARNLIFVLSDANFRRYGPRPSALKPTPRYHRAPFAPLGTVSTLSRGLTPSRPHTRASRGMLSWSALISHLLEQGPSPS